MIFVKKIYCFGVFLILIPKKSNLDTSKNSFLGIFFFDTIMKYFRYHLLNFDTTKNIFDTNRNLFDIKRKYLIPK